MKIDLFESFLISWALIAAVVGYSLYTRNVKPALYFAGVVIALNVIKRIYMATRPPKDIDRSKAIIKNG
jgi:hypothetical protein